MEKIKQNFVMLTGLACRALRKFWADLYDNYHRLTQKVPGYSCKNQRILLDGIFA
jgi:hypothetical protein